LVPEMSMTIIQTDVVRIIGKAVTKYQDVYERTQNYREKGFARRDDKRRKDIVAYPLEASVKRNTILKAQESTKSGSWFNHWQNDLLE